MILAVTIGWLTSVAILALVVIAGLYLIRRM